MITLDKIMKAMTRKGYQIFESDIKLYNLNIVGIRSEDTTANDFNDFICVFWKYKGQWSFLVNKATTDPGLYWRENPISKMGTAIVKPGQYRGLWKLGKHKGETAFQQVKPITVLRDDNGDNVLDFDTAKEQTGLFGINGHNANNNQESINVGKWSAGCQVWANPIEHADIMAKAAIASKLWSNSFTYTLLEEQDL